MFEYTLQSIPPRVAVDASYLTIRFLKHRAEHPKDYIALDIPSEPGPEAQAAALELVQEIEKIEGTTVSALDGGSADSYIGRLATFISEGVRDDVGTDRSRGQVLLNHLRAVNPHATSIRGANMQGGDLRRASLRGADLRGANLHRADLEGAIHLSQEQLEQAVGDGNTTIPEGLTRPAAWWGGSAGARAYVRF